VASPSEIDYEATDPALFSIEDDEGDADAPMSDEEFLNLLRQADTQATTLQTEMTSRWQRAYRAARNEHSTQSKYLTDTWARRSKVFIPRTRTAVEKIMVTAAGALFSTQDVVNIEAQNPENPEDRESASLMQELVNVRLDRANGKTSIPWFQTALGARYDASITGMCCSYQHWLYKREVIPPDPNAPPVFNIDGEVLEPVEQERILVNRPEVTLIAPEHVRFSSGADWHRIAQSSPFLMLDWPMFAQDIMAMCSPENGRTVRWRAVTEDQISGASESRKAESTGVRSAREGRDRYNDQASGEGEWRTQWPRLVFMRVRGVDYTFWALGVSLLLSDPQPVEEVYPEHGGDRPVVIGTDRIEPHKLYPMSFAEGLQPLQQEINDIRNLRLDAVKMAVYPPKSVLRGKNIDFKQLSQNGPDVKWLVDDHTHVMERQSAGPHQSSFAEMDRLNVDFDDTAGLFNTGTVQSQRTLNETVGGMRLMNANASAVSELSLRVWVETWVEPVLSQIVRLESYYEDDMTVLALAAKKAGAFPRFGTSIDLDDMLMRDLLVRVNVGIGSVNPQEKLAKFQQAATITAQILGQKFQSGEIDLKTKNIVDEIWGPAGFRDAADRFLDIKEPGQTQPKEDPAVAEAKAKMEAQQQAQAAELQMKQQMAMAELAQEKEIALIKIAAEKETKIAIARINATSQIAAKREETMAMLSAPGSSMAPGGAPGTALVPQGNDALVPTEPQMPQLGIAAPEPMQPDMSPGPSILDVMTRQHAEMGQQMQALTAIAQQILAAAQAMQQASQTIAAPKRVVRDASGRITGVTMQ
jgi:hypothetical protein